MLDPKTGKVSAATLNKLVMRMTATTSSEDYDPKFMQAFLITYQSFTTPVVLLNKLLERYTASSVPLIFPRPDSCACRVSFRK